MSIAQQTPFSLGTNHGGRSGRRGFTLVELLVVISIIAAVAGLVVYLAKQSSDQKKISRIEVEMKQLETLIEAYHDKLGYYPPSNPANPALNSLYYELAGTVLNGNTYTVRGGSDTLDKSVVSQAFGVGSFLNSSADPSEVQGFGTLQPGEVTTVSGAGWGGAVKVPLVPVEGPGPFNDGPTRTNTWHYNSRNPVHNPNSYDLWAVFYVGSELRTNGNWKR